MRCTPPQSPQHTWTASLASELRLPDAHQEWSPAVSSMVCLTMMKQRFPAHDELSTCGTNLVFPEQSVLRTMQKRKQNTRLRVLSASIS